MKFYCCYNVLVQAVINSNGTYEKTCKKNGVSPENKQTNFIQIYTHNYISMES